MYARTSSSLNSLKEQERSSPALGSRMHCPKRQFPSPISPNWVQTHDPSCPYRYRKRSKNTSPPPPYRVLTSPDSSLSALLNPNPPVSQIRVQEFLQPAPPPSRLRGKEVPPDSLSIGQHQFGLILCYSTLTKVQWQPPGESSISMILVMQCATGGGSLVRGGGGRYKVLLHYCSHLKNTILAHLRAEKGENNKMRARYHRYNVWQLYWSSRMLSTLYTRVWIRHTTSI